MCTLARPTHARSHANIICADFDAITNLASAFKAAGLCSSENVVAIGGVNEGQLTEMLLNLCAVTVHGVEIQREFVIKARQVCADCASSMPACLSSSLSTVVARYVTATLQNSP